MSRTRAPNIPDARGSLRKGAASLGVRLVGLSALEVQYAWVIMLTQSSASGCMWPADHPTRPHDAVCACRGGRHGGTWWVASRYARLRARAITEVFADAAREAASEV
jgi:hypothetical protein